MPHIHRLCFEFKTFEDMTDFWNRLVEMSLRPSDNPYEDEGLEKLGLVHKDSLHDREKHVHDYLVRTHDPTNGNGRVAYPIPDAIEEMIGEAKEGVHQRA